MEHNCLCRKPGNTELLGVSACRYRVFLGNGRYFVSSDVGGGKMQWYAFHKEPAGAMLTHCVLSVLCNCYRHILKSANGRQFTRAVLAHGPVSLD